MRRILLALTLLAALPAQASVAFIIQDGVWCDRAATGAHANQPVMTMAFPKVEIDGVRCEIYVHSTEGFFVADCEGATPAQDAFRTYTFMTSGAGTDAATVQLTHESTRQHRQPTVYQDPLVSRTLGLCAD